MVDPHIPPSKPGDGQTRPGKALGRHILVDLYGSHDGGEHYRYIEHALEKHSCRSSPDAPGAENPYAHVAGKIFAICYPDNVYDSSAPTLETLGYVLERHFPWINGIHLLPERLMSHDDVQPQDLLHLMPAAPANDLIAHLKNRELLDDSGMLTARYGQSRD